jgi:ABC-type transport system substrate-binding protein
MNSFEGAPCYSADYPGRPYDAAKAKQLLTDAGFPNGFKTTIYCESTAYWRDQATAIQASLAKVGIDVKIDIADAARFNDLKTETGWKDGMLFTSWSIGPPYPDAYLFNFDPDRNWFKSMERSPAYSQLCKDINSAKDEQSYFDLATKAIRLQAEEAQCVSLWTGATSYVRAANFHTDFFDQHQTMWWMYDDWLGPKK